MVEMGTANERGEIPLVTGKFYNVLEPESEDQAKLTLQVIGRGLANTCRFAGQLDKFYSVAEHCVIGSYMLEDEIDQRAFMMHDSAEALIHDITKPLKVELPDYVALEERHERIHAQRWGLPYPLQPQVKQVDRVMARIETIYFGKTERLSFTEDPSEDQLQRLEAAGQHGKIRCLDPDQAYAAWLLRANELGLK